MGKIKIILRALKKNIKNSDGYECTEKWEK